MNRLFSLVFSILLTCSSGALAQHDGTATSESAGATSPEIRQFDFLVGEWEIEVHPKVSGLAAMIHGVPRLVGTWKAWRAFDGLGVEDELRIVDASGNPISLIHSLRIYAKAEGHWNVSGLDAYRARLSDATGQWKGSEMDMNGHGVDAEGKPFVSRTRYFNITPDGFRMQQDRSADNGQSWDEAVVTVDAKRATAPAH